MHIWSCKYATTFSFATERLHSDLISSEAKRDVPTCLTWWSNALSKAAFKRDMIADRIPPPARLDQAWAPNPCVFNGLRTTSLIRIWLGCSNPRGSDQSPRHGARRGLRRAITSSSRPPEASSRPTTATEHASTTLQWHLVGTTYYVVRTTVVRST